MCAPQASRDCKRGGSAGGATLTQRPLLGRAVGTSPRAPPPSPVPCAGARMAAGTRPAAGPRSRAAMAQWRKKKGLRKRRGAASQARSSDSEDGEFEIQAEDDARAQKVGARGRDTLWSPSPSPPHRPALGFPQLGKWSQLRVGRGRLAGGRGQGRRREHVRRCPSRRGSGWPRVSAFRGPGPAGLPGRLLVARASLATSRPGGGSSLLLVQ